MSSSTRSTCSRQRRKVLTEEEYQDNLNQIIQRDYFPDLPSLERDVAVYERRAAGDVPGAVAVRRAARRIQAHEEALREQEREDEEAAAENDGIRPVARPLHRESLSNFHARATSEDNVHFESVQSREQSQRKQELLMLTNGPTNKGAASSSNRAPSQSRRHPMLPSPIPLASDQFNPPTPARPSQQSVELENSLFFVPKALQKQQTNGTSEQSLFLMLEDNDETIQDGDSDALALQQMPPPTKRRACAPDKRSLVEYTPTSKMEKRIEPAATRFPKQQQQQQQQLAVHSRPLNTTEWDTGSDTTGLSSTEGDDTDLDSTLGRRTPLHIERMQARKRKEREQETLVQMTPLIVPGGGGNASPIVTWGTVGATPMVIGQAKQSQGMSNKDIDGSSFKMPEESDRERAAARATAYLAKRSRKFREAGTTPRLDPRASLLSPAARALLSRNASGSSSVRSASSFGTALRSSYSVTRPVSGSRAKSSIAGQRDTAFQATPRLNRNDR